MELDLKVGDKVLIKSYQELKRILNNHTSKERFIEILSHISDKIFTVSFVDKKGFCVKENDYIFTFDSVEEVIKQGLSETEIKADKGKPDLRHVPSVAIYAIAEVQEYAREKYKEAYALNPKNHLLVEPHRWHMAILRHVEAIREDFNGVDSESGIMHLKHIMCSCAYLLEKLESMED